MSGQRHALATIYSGERTASTHWIGGWVGLRAGLNTEAREKNPLSLPGIETRSFSLQSDTILTELPQLLKFKQCLDIFSGKQIQCGGFLATYVLEILHLSLEKRLAYFCIFAYSGSEFYPNQQDIGCSGLH
jgi:hypothetical protein